MFLMLSPLRSPEDSNDAPAPGGGVENTIDFFASDDKSPEEDSTEDLLETDEDTEVKPKAKKDDKEPEIEIEDEDKDEPDETDLELVTPVRRKEILKKYPELFKDFPYLEKAYYREQQFTELFPTIEDAKEAQETVKEFTQFSESLLSGDAEPVLKSVKESNPDAFNTIVDGYLTTLSKVDNNAYLHVISNVIKEAVIAAVNTAKADGNEDLLASAENMYRFIFGTNKFIAPGFFGKGPKNPNGEESKVSAERQQLAKERFDTAIDTVSNTVNNAIKSTISQHIDPKGVMTPYVRNNAIKDAMTKVDEIMAADTRFKALNDKLWVKASENGYNAESMKAIKSNYLARVKTVLRDVIRSTRNEALKGTGRSINDDDTEVIDRKGPIKRGGSGPQIKSENNSNKIPKGMRTIDFLNQD